MNKENRTDPAKFGQAVSDPVYRRLLEELIRAKQPLNLSGLSDALKIWLLNSIGAELARPVCFLVADELKARSYAQELANLTDRQVLSFRPREWHFSDVDAVSHEIEHQRMAIMSQVTDGDYGVLIVSAGAAMQKLPPVSTFRNQRVSFTIGQLVEPEGLASILLAAGYEQVRLAEACGQFARRGDIVDFVPPMAADDQETTGIRISFFDREIDSIRVFNPDSQRSTEMLERIIIAPIRETVTHDSPAAVLADSIEAAAQAVVEKARSQGAKRDQIDRLLRLAAHDTERIRQGIRFPALDRWLSFIFPDADCIIDYARTDETIFIIDEPAGFRQRADAAQAEYVARMTHLHEQGQVLAGTKSNIFTGLDLGKKINLLRPVLSLSQIFSDGNGLPGGLGLSVKAQAAESYRGREHDLLSDVRQWLDQGDQVYLFAGTNQRQERLTALFLQNGLNPQILADALSRGFVWPGAHVAVLGTSDLFGTEKRRSRHKQSGLKIDLFSDLVPGELVVHEDHGIGCYDGLVNLASQGSRRDYLKINYAGDDVLYIPIESLAQIQKYISPGERKPRLAKLGGQEWHRLKERAQSSIKKLATDLVELYARRLTQRGISFSGDTVWQQEFEEQFPYEETDDQLRTVSEIKADMESNRVMDRLLCGDVGYGKTEVAFRALFKCVMSGYQGVFFAPTTVLAQQHYDNLIERLRGFPVTVRLLSRFVSRTAQAKTIEDLKNGTVDIVVGTHRLLARDILLKKPGLLVVDEEQRLGVDHKEQFKVQWPNIDVLTLSATPIPRTLHMAMSGIRDISVLEDPPQDRRPVQTYVLGYDEDILTEAILREVARRGQVFYLFNDTRRIWEKVAQIEEQLPGIRVSCAHGQMNEREMEDNISAFLRQESDVLVCTTIIESGIDMPNVNTIIVENADRLGLAQLYQLRGRVGRSNRQAYAFITYQPDRALTEVAQKRLTAIRDYTEFGSGFKIALKDLEVRGAGNLLGGEQHGNLAAIGYDLYSKMLEEAVSELKGELKRETIATVIDLKVDAFVSAQYVPDEGQRMDLYRRIAQIDSSAAYRDVVDECIDRYGEMPEAALTLIDISFVRSAAGQHGFSRVEQRQNNLLLRYDKVFTPDMQDLSAILNQELYRGALLFNAGTQPYILYRSGAADKKTVAANLRNLFLSWDQAG